MRRSASAGRRLARAILARLCRVVLNPYETIEKLQEKRNHRKTSDDAGADSVKQVMTSPSMKNKVERSGEELSL